jgi:4-hydroxy-tetrahydrodipicolinate reductase
MANVVVGGATGRLGRLVCDLIEASGDLRLVGAVVSEEGGHVGREVAPGIKAVGPGSLKDVLEGADVYVDLTTPSAASKVIAEIPATGTNLILGTTAVDADAVSRMADEVARCGTSALVAANFSAGVNVFWKACEILAGMLPGYDIEVVEAHHADKRDAPSGTAKEAVRRLQAVTGIEDVVYGRNGITGPRGREIGVHSVRAGDIVGSHTVLMAKNQECVELTHKAISGEALANGCIASIRWMADKKDGKVHSMNEVFGL